MSVWCATRFADDGCSRGTRTNPCFYWMLDGKRKIRLDAMSFKPVMGELLPISHMWLVLLSNAPSKIVIFFIEKIFLPKKEKTKSTFSFFKADAYAYGLLNINEVPSTKNYLECFLCGLPEDERFSCGQPDAERFSCGQPDDELCLMWPACCWAIAHVASLIMSPVSWGQLLVKGCSCLF